MKKTILTFFVLLLSCDAMAQKTIRIWYDKPAESWMREALPLGNGYMGAMFFGGVECEHIQFTEGSLWSGGPNAHPNYNFGNRDSAYICLPKVRECLQANQFDEAEAVMQERMTGYIHYPENSGEFGDFGSQQTMGDAYIQVLNPLKSATDYQRSIDLSKGRGEVTFKTGNIHHQRTYFGDYPDKMMVYAYQTNEPLNYSFIYKTPHPLDTAFFSDNILTCQAHLADNGMRFETCFKIVTDGDVRFLNDTLFITGTKTFYIYHTAATSYKNDYPTYEGNDPHLFCQQVMDELEGKTYDEIAKTQLEDYTELFDRVVLELGGGRDDLPTDERLVRYAQGEKDLGLEEIYFQYGRYLMISASRAGALPMNLQGKWNHSTRPPWACDYHFNINLEMLYWPAEVTNLPECHEPLMDYVESLVEPGRVATRNFYNTRGWTVQVMNNPFGFAAPGWHISWGWFPGGAAWISRHLWDHYRYNQDTVFLRTKAFPIMKEAALFWIDYLVDDGTGHLVSSPSFSPEHGRVSMGASMDHQIATDILQNCIDACQVLQLEESFLDTLISVKSRILPPEIGRWGQLKEWREDVDDPNDKHRHVSHLYALYPACQITVDGTPELAEAAKTSLQARGDEGTGWSLAWKINFWARLQDGNKAYSLLRNLLRPVHDEGFNMMNGGGTYSNLFCAHPPFQLDGNMGAVAGIANLLLDPVSGKPLPALPAAWPNGHVKGLKTQSGHEIEIVWKDGKVVKYEVR